MIDLNDVRVFEQVATLAGFSEAARTLGLPRSSVSRSVARLEEALGIRLLQRTTRDVQVTEAGRALLDRAGGPLSKLAEATSFTASLAAAPRGRLAISAGLGFGVNVLGRQLPAFLDRYPDVDVVVELASRDVDLVGDRIDVAIRMGPLSDSGMVATRLGVMSRYVCASPSYLRRRGRPAEPQDLHSHTIVDMPSGRARPWTFTRGEEAVHFEPAPRVAVNDALTIHRLLCEGGGIGVSSAYLCGPDILAGNLERLLPDWSLLPLEVSMLFPSNREMSPSVRAFVDFMKERNTGVDGWQLDRLASEGQTIA